MVAHKAFMKHLEKQNRGSNDNQSLINDVRRNRTSNQLSHMKVLQQTTQLFYILLLAFIN